MCAGSLTIISLGASGLRATTWASSAWSVTTTPWTTKLPSLSSTQTEGQPPCSLVPSMPMNRSAMVAPSVRTCADLHVSLNGGCGTVKR